ncbi:hypothetical protein [Streptomyces sp. NPDC051016]|uniref:hypothetical protein n=1 Tax=Streptomyces sp. NPDC051016 TaxID=3365638 RepID=UPI0037994CC4
MTVRQVGEFSARCRAIDGLADTTGNGRLDPGGRHDDGVRGSLQVEDGPTRRPR